jgi:hypothetical protein
MANALMKDTKLGFSGCESQNSTEHILSFLANAMSEPLYQRKSLGFNGPPCYRVKTHLCDFADWGYARHESNCGRLQPETRITTIYDLQLLKVE